MLRYGNFNAGHGKTKQNTRLQRFEELKNMYQTAMKGRGMYLFLHTVLLHMLSLPTLIDLIKHRVILDKPLLLLSFMFMSDMCLSFRACGTT